MTLRIYLRIFGYVATLAMHITNILYMASFHQGEVMEDPVIRAYIGAQTRFITCWNFALQTIYAALGLTCDLMTLQNSAKKNYKLPYILSESRDLLFTAILWPSTFVVATLFWPFFLYDKGLVYPDFIDRILTPLSNHIIHSAIVPVVLWEIVLQPRKEPESHTKNGVLLFVYSVVYLFVLFYTFIEKGFWIYPIFNRIEGTIYFPILIMYTSFLVYINYKTQWCITSWLWGKNTKKEVRRKTK